MNDIDTEAVGAEIFHDPQTRAYYVRDGFDLSIFENAPPEGPYPTADDARAAHRARGDLASGASAD
jgi:hypothetical protein